MFGLCDHISRTLATSSTRQYSTFISKSIGGSHLIASRSSNFHSSGRLLAKRRRDFFSSNSTLRAEAKEERKTENRATAKRKSTRTSAAANSLRRVAVEAQRSRDGKEQKRPSLAGQDVSKTVTALCAAQEYDIAHIARILEGFGYELDPYGTELYPQVVHVALPVQVPSEQGEASWNTGDLFVFPSGTIVAWDIPDDTLTSLLSGALKPAATSPLSKVEEEDLEYVEDPTRENSSIKGDRIVLGTKPQASQSRPDVENMVGQTSTIRAGNTATQSRSLDTALAKIAFSSGLARSTKLAVLESLLSNYFESTRSIPEVLSRGGRLPFTRSFILQKTGQLLSIRAQLNLYSELTDSLPDLFWDSRHELGLEGYYDQVGKALDTNIRIKVLNEKMDYAQEIASVLRQQLSEKHGVRLEWIIILLIAVEVLFAIDKEVKDYRERSANSLRAQ